MQFSLIHNMSKEVEFKVSKCKTRAAYSVKPVRRIKLDLKKIKEKFDVIVDTSLLLVVKEGDEIIVHGYGELLFKTWTDEDKIASVAKRIYEVGA